VERLLCQRAAIASFGSFARRERDLLKILTEAARVCADGLRVPFSNVCRYRAAENDLFVVAGHGWHDGVIGHVVSRADASSPQGRAFTTGEPTICGDLRKDSGFELPPFYAAHGIASTVDVIIKGSDDLPYGILEIDNDQQHDYDQHDIDFLAAFANVLAEAVSTATRSAALQVCIDRMKELVAEKDRLVRQKEASDQQLWQAQKMEVVGQLASGVAHDLNNVLTVIVGAAGILIDAVSDRPEIAALAKMIDSAAAHGGDLTQRLLAFARQQPLQRREVDVNSLVIDAAKLLRPTLGTRVQIETKLAADTSLSLTDPSQLNHAILNLALNARDAMLDGGKLTIETGNVILDDDDFRTNGEISGGNYVMVMVTDSGLGIPADVLSRVFEPCFTTKDVGKGAGLGLSMVHGFVKQSNGHINISSEVGHGTAVRIYLPSVIVEARPAEVAAASVLEGGRETILVVAAAQRDCFVRPNR
jgi:signal transduction histidine kinase